jgi:DNA polymerase-4
VGYLEAPDFHVAVARLGRPELEGTPFVVGGDPEKRGKVLAATPDLVDRGIEPGMRVAEALSRSPGARWIETDMKRVRESSGRLRAAVRQEVESLEVEGLAGFYFEAPAEREAAEALSSRLRTRVFEETGLPVRMGVAPVRFAARMAAESAAEGEAIVIEEKSFQAFLEAQPLERFPGVGPKTAARLAELGAQDVPGLRVLGRERLEILLGNHGRSLWLLSTGEDPKPLRVRRHPATLSRERTLAHDAGRSQGGVTEAIGRLADSLSAALVREGLAAERIALRLTYEGTRSLTRSQVFPVPVAGAGEIASAALLLLDRIGASGKAVRKVALVLAGLDHRGAEDRQLDLF